MLMLGRVPQAMIERAAADPRFLAAYRRACERFSTYVARSEPGEGRLIAYFSMGIRHGGMHAHLRRRPGCALRRSFVQVNVVVPSGLATGTYPLTVTIGSETSNSATISVTQ